MPVNWYRNYWIHNGLKNVNSQRFPFDYHKTNSGKYKISLRGEPLLSSDEKSGTEIDDKGDECVEEKRKLSPHVTDIPVVKKLPLFRGFEHKLVHREFNPCLPKLRIIESLECYLFENQIVNLGC